MQLKLNNKKIIIFGAIIILIVAAYFISLKSGSSRKVTATFDDFPIWLMRGGKVAVYRELDFYDDSLEKQIVVVNLGNESQTNLKIYESISKNIAQSVSELQFNVQPEIIQDDPIIAWNIETNKAGERILFTLGKKINLSKVSDACKEEGVIQKMISLNLKPELFNDCMQYWRIVEEEAQRQVEQDLKEEIEVVEPEDSNYKEIQEEAKKAIPEKKVELTKKDTEENYQEKDSSSQWTVYFSEDMFPSELSGIPRISTQDEPQTETCYDKLYPGKYFSALYQDSNKIISVAATQYLNNEVAKTVPQICSDFVEEKFSTSEYKTSVNLERKENVLGYPFWMSTASYQGSPVIAGAYSVIEDTVIAVVNPNADATETEYRNAMTIVLTYIKQKVGCGGDSDCASSLCYNCQLGKRICSKGSCVECTYDGHCNNGFECKDNYCKQKEVLTPPENESIGNGCQSINLSVADALYNQTKASSPCDQFQNSLNGQNLITLRCADRYANWRYYWVKEMNVAGKQKIEIKTDLGIKDYSSFFSECNYNGGVKYDNYVGLIVLKEDPMPKLDMECYKKASEEEWSTCSVPTSGSDVLGFCGISKCTTSKTCDFEVDTSGEDNIYLVFHTSDAWSADIEGSLSNLEICSE